MITLQKVQDAEELCLFLAAIALGLSVSALSSEGNSSSGNLHGNSGSGAGGETEGFHRLGGAYCVGPSSKVVNKYDASRIPAELVGESCNTICQKVGNTSCMWGLVAYRPFEFAQASRRGDCQAKTNKYSACMCNGREFGSAHQLGANKKEK
jgi:hypothetical protein